MAKKSFEIQGSTLRIGGVDLQAGTTGVVIPGITQATTYIPEEVEKISDDETTWDTPPVIIDHYTWLVLSNSGTPEQGWTAPTYEAQLDDNRIDEIDITSLGAGITQQIATVMTDNIYAAPAGTSVDPETFDFNLWTVMPYNVKCEVGEVENIGGGNANTGSITFEDNNIIGSGEDSGDGNGYDTIRLVPDADLVGNDQYIIIDPTTPSHIHIRAGGTQDASNAELYLGGETAHVRVTNNNNGVYLRADGTTYNSVNNTDGVEFTSGSWYTDSGTNYLQFTTVSNPMIDGFYQIGSHPDDQFYLADGVNSYYLTVAPNTGRENLGGGTFRLSVVQAPDTSPFVPTTINMEYYTVNQNYIELTTDFRVDVQDDIRMFGKDVFRLVNRSVDEPIEIITDDNNNSYTWSFGANGVLTLPQGGDIVDNNNVSVLGGSNILSTVAKVGSGVPATGEVATITLNPTNNTNFTPGTYYGVFLGIGSGFNMTFDVAVNGDLTATIVSSNSGFVGGETGSLNGGAIAGGTVGVDDIGVTVASLTNIAYPTVLDLTKQVQKLSDGWYTLQDGAEGQIMHLVASSSLTDANSVRVVIANARIGTNVGTDYWLYPFDVSNGGVHGFSTVIFVDGAWQANGGVWD